MPKKSLEEMKESEEICNYCVYGETKMLWFPEVPQDDQCVSCGSYVPEGRMVCPTCERNPSHVLHKKGV